MQRISEEEFALLAANIPDAPPKTSAKQYRKGSLDAVALDHMFRLPASQSFAMAGDGSFGSMNKTATAVWRCALSEH